MKGLVSCGLITYIGRDEEYVGEISQWRAGSSTWKCLIVYGEILTELAMELATSDVSLGRAVLPTKKHGRA
jgi:hypothetical protein